MYEEKNMPKILNQSTHEFISCIGMNYLYRNKLPKEYTTKLAIPVVSVYLFVSKCEDINKDMIFLCYHEGEDIEYIYQRPPGWRMNDIDK